MYMKKANNRKSRKFSQELKIIQELKNRLNAGDGWTRIVMNSDNQEIDIAITVDNRYHLSFPPYYDSSKKGTYRALNKWFAGLDEVAEFLLCDGWKR